MPPWVAPAIGAATGAAGLGLQAAGGGGGGGSQQGRVLTPQELYMQQLAAQAAGQLGQTLGAPPVPYYGPFVAPMSSFEMAGLSKLLQNTMGAPAISPFAGGEVPMGPGGYAPPTTYPQPLKSGPRSAPPTRMAGTINPQKKGVY